MSRIFILLLTLGIVIGFSLIDLDFDQFHINKIIYKITSIGIHIVLFFLTGAVLTSTILNYFKDGMKKNSIHIFLFSCAILLAGVSEYLQYASPRDASFADFGFDLIGFYLGVLLFNKLSKSNLSKYFKT